MLLSLPPPASADRRAILELLPELDGLARPSRDRCVRVWAGAWRAGYWPDLASAPTLLDVPAVDAATLVAHTRRVLNACRALAQSVSSQSYRPDFDSLLEAAALHDVAKLVEYMPAEAGPGLSPEGRSLHHAAIGAQWALAAGSTPEVAHAIYAHTPTISAAPATLEAVILFAADQVDADVVRVAAGGRPLTKQAMLAGATRA